jgi:hypothetical protein
VKSIILSYSCVERFPRSLWCPWGIALGESSDDGHRYDHHLIHGILHAVVILTISKGFECSQALMTMAIMGS